MSETTSDPFPAAAASRPVADGLSPRASRIAAALTVAGSDSGGGAGIQADLKAFSAMGVYGASAITAITAQNTRGVTAVELLPPALVAAQIAAVLDDIAIGAVKIGMLGSAGLTETVARALSGFGGPVVLDPVMVAKSGDSLLAPEAVAALVEHLLPRATLLDAEPARSRAPAGDATRRAAPRTLCARDGRCARWAPGRC